MNIESSDRSTNIWDYKPAWCQPWSIILTGTTIVAASWLVLHTVWLTILVSLAIAAWWVYFLILYPKMFARYMSSQQAMANLGNG